jgi:hypothetical protein
MHRTTRTCAALVVLALSLLACGSDAGTNPSPVANLTGVWTYSRNLSSAAAGASCIFTGSVTLAQSGTSFNGEGPATSVCTDALGNISTTSGTSPFVGGQVNGQQVTFSIGVCSATGTISGSPANRMSGSESCPIASGGVTYIFTGPWQASR